MRVSRMFLAFSCLTASPVFGQVSVPTPFSPIIGGVQVHCTAASGQPVAFVLNPVLNDVGRAVPGLPPRIEINPSVLAQFPPKLQLFWYGHECGHHALGHTSFAAFANESAADCWAIRTMKGQGLLTREDVADIGPYFAQIPGSLWGHLPGPDRLKLFEKCYGAASTRDDVIDSPPRRPRDDDSCQSQYRSCVADVRSVEQCVEDEFPDRCIRTCMSSYGFSRRECETRRCLQTPENLRGWRSRCADLVRDEREACAKEKRSCSGDDER